MTERHKKALYAAAIAIFILFTLAVSWFVGRPLIRFVRQPEQFRAWVQGHGLLGQLAFLGMTVLQIVIAIIPGEPLELGAGYAFGFWRGTLLCEIGILLGGLLVFLFVRRFGVKAVEVFFPREKIESLRFLHNEKRLALWVFILFFIPGTPKDIMTYIVPLTPMKLSTFLLLSTVARLPSVVTSTIGGNALGTGKLTFALIVFSATALISALGILIYRRICKRSEARQKEEQA
ncbi:MAG: TVP38/TMEM64 family protein [Eubacteriales bacterium]|nr:TVP38/TMEM64 family protein [Eubacteriales bacterium]